MKLITTTQGSDTRLTIVLDPRPLTRDEVKELAQKLFDWLDATRPDWRCVIEPRPAEAVAWKLPAMPEGEL